MNKLIANRYKLIQNIGSGGMADVYLAYDNLLNRNVAVKIMKGDLSGDDVAIERFKREASSISQLYHPNIVEIYDVGIFEKNYYIVMEYLEGKTLKQIIKERGNLNYKEAAFIMRQLISAVSKAHKASIIHRDIKSQNIIIMSDGRLKILDFGVALALNSAQITATDSILGSVHYLAPEISKGALADEKSDIYAMGIVFFELLTGKLPFTGDNAVGIVIKHIKEDLPFVRDYNPEIPQAIENIIIKACAKNKNARYASADKMLEDLNNALTNNKTNISRIQLKDKKELIKKKRKNFNIKLFLISICSFLLISCIIISFLYLGGFFTSNNRNTKVPDISNLTVLEADDKLISYNLSIDLSDIKRELTENIPKGKIISFTPKADSEVEKGSKIKVVVSDGIYSIMKDYRNQDFKTVSDSIKLEYPNLHILSEAKENDQVKAGQVFAQELIEAGSHFDPSTPSQIKLIYRPYDSIIIPLSLKTLNIYDAKAFLEEKGFKVSLERLDDAKFSPEEKEKLIRDQVVNTNPEFGSSYIQDDEQKTITLYYY